MVISLHAAPRGGAWEVRDGDVPVRRFTSVTAAEQVAWALSRARVCAFTPVLIGGGPVIPCPFTGVPGGD